MNKKAQGLPLNTIIIAIIVIVVLVVLVMVFTGSIGITTTELVNCKSKANHECLASCSAADGWATDNQYKCLDADKKPMPGMVCCVKTGQVETWLTCEKAGYNEASKDDCLTEYTGQLDATPAAGNVCCTTICSNVKDIGVCDDGGTPDDVTDDVTTAVKTLGGKYCCD